jgi:hypothetical protein
MTESHEPQPSRLLFVDLTLQVIRQQEVWDTIRAKDDMTSFILDDPLRFPSHVLTHGDYVVKVLCLNVELVVKEPLKQTGEQMSLRMVAIAFMVP